MIRKWNILNRELVKDFRLFKVQTKQVRSPRTGDIKDVQVIRFPPWVMVLALTAKNEVVMIRQYRHGIEQICLELPGGLVDPEDPTPAVAAQRELLEETGYRTYDFVHLGECFPQPAVLSNECSFFLAKDAERVQEPMLDPGEDIEVVCVPLKTIPAMIETEEINNGMVLLAFFLYCLKEGKKFDSMGR
jgi:8-oxo-dGTP pyrophosphatase MutT (NUDIX family)